MLTGRWWKELRWLITDTVPDQGPQDHPAFVSLYLANYTFRYKWAEFVSIDKDGTVCEYECRPATIGNQWGCVAGRFLITKRLDKSIENWQQQIRER